MSGVSEIIPGRRGCFCLEGLSYTGQVMTAKERLQLELTAMSEEEAAVLLAQLEASKSASAPLSFASLGRSGRPDLGTTYKELRKAEFGR